MEVVNDGAAPARRDRAARPVRHFAPALRRLLFFGLVAASAGCALYLMIDIVAANGVSLIEAAIVLLFTVNFTWIAMSFWTAAIGFLLQLARPRGPTARGLREPGDDEPLTARTAIVMPIYKEDTHRVFAGLEAIHRSLAATGQLDRFDLFVLSDTPEPEIAAAEARAWHRLCARTGGAGRVFYRRRADNRGRKAGNIADFCRRWGRDYDHLLVLDADSVMSGGAIVRLARLMQANPTAGIIQSFPVPVGRETLFARIIQFANRLYGPVLARGLAFWHGGDSNYWGHNAIIRTAAFIEHCGLPLLPGRAPLGGEILSHDFVEAALIRRAGWTVWLLPEVGESYEEVPANLIDYAARDRRWCQGNLQHLKLLGARRLHPLSRVHLAMGVMAYLSSPLWLILLLLSTVDIVLLSMREHAYFPEAGGLFPVWPISKAAEALTLFGVTLGMLVLPKIFGLAVALLAPGERRRFGGGARLVAGTLLEQLHSMLQAPVLMLFHSRFVGAVLLGRDGGWNAQARDDRGLDWREALARHGGQSLVGLVWACLVLVVAPQFFWWLLPVIAGLVVAPAHGWLASRRGVGRAARRLGLFATPEERDPPPVLHGLARALARGSVPPQPSPYALAIARSGAPRPIRVVLPAASAPPLPETRPCEMPAQRLDYPGWLGFVLSL